jgi:predicted nucleic acid-binding protein
MVDASERLGRTAVVWIDRKLEDDGWRVFLQFDDQNFSFCDCTSIAICRNLGIDTVFGFDADFAIAGLELRPSA